MKLRKVVWYAVVLMVFTVVGAYGIINGVWI
jgi:hypothetical protein